eukprot:TRINITY_DN11159_c0_g2_i7.p1 TRINITY_DN11159_c0_g2~~TRINITY_DN11159_c0_g2_i7.p1  ORF type:complete len:559 (+),score=93.39 TRINITY_DN11159_c0_g2_i7:385-2061(+)
MRGFCFSAMLLLIAAADSHNFRRQAPWHGSFNASHYREVTRAMFERAYNEYMTHAFPHDELDPIHCVGRSSDPDKTNININDVLGNYSLTLIDSLDTLAIMGNKTRFHDAIDMVVRHVDFDQDTTVQVFEANIRVLGGLLSAHLIAKGHILPHMAYDPLAYDDELLWLARDLAARLLPAFDVTNTGLPLPRVNLRHGAVNGSFWRNDTCSAGAGTLLLEFGVLSALSQDPTYEGVARRALHALWNYRSATTGLLGSSIDIHTGRWVNTMSGFGAGMDSFYEYLFKSYIMFGHHSDLALFSTAFRNTARRTRVNNAPLHGNVDMNSGRLINTWIDSLQAFLPGLKAGMGDVQGAIVDHAVYLAIWRRYQALPERFNYRLKKPDFGVYPLRPELFESTYLLYRATRNKYYQRVGAEMLMDLLKHTTAPCGYATLHDVADKSKEDRMESFFLSETLKYLYLLFDDDHPLHQPNATQHLFTTEGHVLPILSKFRADADDVLRPHIPDGQFRPSDGPGLQYIAGSGSNRTEMTCHGYTRGVRTITADLQHRINEFVGLNGEYY